MLYNILLYILSISIRAELYDFLPLFHSEVCLIRVLYVHERNVIMKLLQIYVLVGTLCKCRSSINLLSFRAYMSLQYSGAYINVFVVRMDLMP